jgi:hypothetical protein
MKVKIGDKVCVPIKKSEIEFVIYKVPDYRKPRIAFKIRNQSQDVRGQVEINLSDLPDGIFSILVKYRDKTPYWYKTKVYVGELVDKLTSLLSEKKQTKKEV